MNEETTRTDAGPIEPETGRGLFGITTVEDFFQKVCVKNYARLEKDIDDPGAAMNCILSLYHLHEWVWRGWLKGRYEVLVKLGIRNSEQNKPYDGWINWLDRECPHFDLLRELSRGTKHCKPLSHTTQRVAGWGSGPYVVGHYGTSYLHIDLRGDEELTTRHLVASTVLKEILEFWRAFFTEYRVFDPPEADTAT